jgi:hypothetical protein
MAERPTQRHSDGTDLELIWEIEGSMSRNMGTRWNALAWLAVASAALLLTGCDGGPPRAPAKGIVLLDGKPLTGGEGVVRFQTVDGFQFARGVIGPDGRFVLETPGSGEGAIIGECEVSVAYVKPPPPATEGEQPVGESLVPDHYSQGTTSGLRETITAEGPNEFTIELSSGRRR